MKINRKKYQPYLLLFLGFVMLYTFLGMCISYYGTDGRLTFFGMDNGRVFGDLIYITGDHYRIKVHPLLLLLLQPIVQMLRGALQSDTLAVIIYQAVFGATSVALVYGILQKLKVMMIDSIIIALTYGCSFSIMMMSSVPESFIFAGTLMAAWWYYVLCIREESTGFSVREVVVILFFGVASFGITLTNYLPYMLGLIYLIWKRYAILRDRIVKFVQLNILNIPVILIGAGIQKLAWIDSPFFATSIFNALFEKSGYEETLYMNFDFSLAKLEMWVKQVLGYPLLAGNVHLFDEETYYPFWFTGYEVPVVKYIILAMLILLTLLIFHILFAKNKDGCVMMMLLVLCWNLGLHFIYSSNEAFIYAPHFLFLIFVLLGVSVNNFRNIYVKKGIRGFFVLFLIAEVVNNIYRYFETINIAMQWQNLTYSISKAVFTAIVVGGVALLSYKVGFRRTQMQETRDTTNIFIKGILTYICIILLCSISFFINYTWQ